MRKAILFLAGLAQLSACTSSQKDNQRIKDTSAVRPSNKPAVSVNKKPCEGRDTLVYGDTAIFASYTEYKMRGSGVISFQLDINNRLDILYPDESKFGFLVLNEDETFYTSDMPLKLVARQVIPEYDFARLDFDAEAVDTNKDYLIIYANKEKLMVKKSSVKYTFSSWENYVKSQTIQLQPCNLLAGAAGYPDMLFDVTEVKGDSIQIKSSSKECMGPDIKFKQLEGWLRWKKDGNLLIDFSMCD
jgi:hypothetical protein